METMTDFFDIDKGESTADTVGMAKGIPGHVDADGKSNIDLTGDGVGGVKLGDIGYGWTGADQFILADDKHVSACVEKSVAGDAFSPPVSIHHDMKLAAKTPLQILAKNRFEVVPGLYIWSDTPLFIEFDKPTIIRGPEVLDEKFAKGWSKLPIEVKVQILSFDHKLNGNISRKNKTHSIGQPSGWKSLARYHAMTPELGTLATQIFYETHNFQLVIPHNSTTGEVKPMFYPKREVNKWIRIISVRVPLHVDAWVQLANLASGNCGFDNLKHVVVELDVSILFAQTLDHGSIGECAIHNTKEFFTEIASMNMIFGCDGEIIIVGGGGELQDFMVQALKERALDTELIRKMISFGAKN